MTELPDRRLTLVGQRRLMEWLLFLDAEGWPKASKQKMTDLWLELHDENGIILAADPTSE